MISHDTGHARGLNHCILGSLGEVINPRVRHANIGSAERREKFTRVRIVDAMRPLQFLVQVNLEIPS